MQPVAKTKSTFPQHDTTEDNIIENYVVTVSLDEFISIKTLNHWFTRIIIYLNLWIVLYALYVSGTHLFDFACSSQLTTIPILWRQWASAILLDHSATFPVVLRWTLQSAAKRWCLLLCALHIKSERVTNCKTSSSLSQPAAEVSNFDDRWY